MKDVSNFGQSVKVKNEKNEPALVPFRVGNAA